MLLGSFARSQQNTSVGSQDYFEHGLQIEVQVITVPSGKLPVPRLLRPHSLSVFVLEIQAYKRNSSTQVLDVITLYVFSLKKQEKNSAWRERSVVSLASGQGSRRLPVSKHQASFKGYYLRNLSKP